MQRVSVANQVAAVLGVVAAFSAADGARASGFALMEQNASGLGNAFAGAAAAAEDASTVYFNPAGLSWLPAGKQLVLGVDAIGQSIHFNDSGSVAVGAPFPRPLGSDGGNAGGLAGVPHFYFAMDLAPNWRFGLGVNAPFGLKTEYASDWIGRYQAIKSQVEAINLNPSVSYRLNDRVSLGFGLDYQHFSAEFTNSVYLGPFGDASADINASDSNWGWNAGAMFQVTPQTRLGIAYRSDIRYHLTGTASFSSPLVTSGNVSADIDVPDSLSFALRHELDAKWTLLGDLSWTGWSKIQNLTIVRDNGKVLSTTPENWRDTWRLGVGANYRYNDRWSFRFGVAYDQTPVSDPYRTPRLPDQNRFWLALGAQYRLSLASALDFGYAHIFVQNASINQANPPVPPLPTGSLVGNYKASVDILGVQFRHTF